MRSRRLFALWTATLLAVTGCGLFETRGLVIPSESPDIPFRQAVDPDSVLFNYEHAARYLDFGEPQIGEALSSEYSMHLTPSDSLAMTFGSLDRIQTLSAYADRMLDTVADTVYFAFLGYEERTPETIGTTARYDTLRYVCDFYKRSGSDLLLLESLSGKATVTFENTGTEWLLKKWQDVDDDSGNKTWGRYLGEACESCLETAN